MGMVGNGGECVGMLKKGGKYVRMVVNRWERWRKVGMVRSGGKWLGIGDWLGIGEIKGNGTKSAEW